MIILWFILFVFVAWTCLYMLLLVGTWQDQEALRKHMERKSK